MSEIKYLTVKEASGFCYATSLPRSTKSIRRWCANGDIEAEKRPNGRTEQWFINRESLEIKIKEELEFLKQSDRSFSQPVNQNMQASDMSAHERTQADISPHERSQADMSGHERIQPDRQSQPQIRDLEDQILLLKNDIKWRDQVLKDQKKATQVLMNEVKGQSRYIGHLETNVLRLGGNTDSAFLAAPLPKSTPSEGPQDIPELTNPEIAQNQYHHPD